ncbi:MAG: hypothetical protein ABIR31_06860, partial [Ginsengibacter sp.]
LGSIVESIINGRKIKFLDKGFINSTITIVDKKTKHVIGSIMISNMLTFKPIATLKIDVHHRYRWTSPQIFAKSWLWTNLTSGQTTIKSNEPLNIFSHKGVITIIEKTDHDDLLIAVGIHLRNVTHLKMHLIRLIALILVIILGSILFWR